MYNGSKKSEEEIDIAVGKLILEIMPEADSVFVMLASQKTLVMEAIGDYDMLLKAISYLASNNPDFAIMLEKALLKAKALNGQTQLSVMARHSAANNLN